MSLWEMSLSGAVMIIVIVILRALFINRLPKKAFLILWGIVMLRLVISFQVPSVFSIYSLIPEREQKQQTEYVQNNLNETVFYNTGTWENRTIEADTVIAEVSESATNRVSLRWLIWMAGVSICSGYFLVAYRKLYRELRMSFPVESEQTSQWLAKHQGKRHIEIRQSDRVSAPLSYGFCHPVILFPKKTDWEKEREIAYVLEHEYVHIRRYDSITKLLITGVTCIHWFNPLVWVMYILFNRDLELACDEEVVHQFGSHSKAAYARTLIAMEEQKSGYMPLCNNFSKNAIEERITAIMKMKKTSVAMLLAAAGLIVSVTVVFASSATKANGNEEGYLTEDVRGASFEETEYQELLKEYEKFGITDEDGILYYKGEPVRLFLDGYEHEKENGETNIISRCTKFNEEGTVDVHTVRNDVKNADGSTTLFGEIINIVPYTQEEFEARDISRYHKQIGSGEATTVEESDGSGKTIEQYLKPFESYGITYQKISGNSGNIYWNGELVGEFWDKKPDGSIFLTESELSSDVAVHTVYDENGKLLGISYLSEDVSDNVSASIQESVMLSYEENGATLDAGEPEKEEMLQADKIESGLQSVKKQERISVREKLAEMKEKSAKQQDSERPEVEKSKKKEECL